MYTADRQKTKEKQLYLFGFGKDSGKAGGRPKVILPLDTLILLGVIIILLFTISFSLGVERGKKTAFKMAKEKVNLSPVLEEKESQKQPAQPEEPIATAPQESVGNKTEEKEKYHVQVASFHKENSARREAKRLEDSGYPVVIMQKGNYIVIYVGGFGDKKEAKNNFLDLRKRYKDCFLKKL